MQRPSRVLPYERERKNGEEEERKGAMITYPREKKIARIDFERKYLRICTNNSTFREVFFFFILKKRERNIRTRDESDDETDHHVPEEVNFTTRPVIVDFRHDVLIQ